MKTILSIDCLLTGEENARRWPRAVAALGVVEVSVSLLAVIVDCHDPCRQAEWWAQVLVYEVNRRNPDEFQVSDPAHVGGSLYFMKVPEPKVWAKNRLHLDLVTSGSMEAEVAAGRGGSPDGRSAARPSVVRQPRHLDGDA